MASSSCSSPMHLYFSLLASLHPFPDRFFPHYLHRSSEIMKSLHSQVAFCNLGSQYLYSEVNSVTSQTFQITFYTIYGWFIIPNHCLIIPVPHLIDKEPALSLLLSLSIQWFSILITVVTNFLALYNTTVSF